MRNTSLCECGNVIRMPSRTKPGSRKRLRYKRIKHHDMCERCWCAALDSAKRGLRPHERVPELWARWDGERPA